MKLFSQEKCVSFTWQSWCRVIADYGQFIPTVHDPQRPFGQIWNLTKTWQKLLRKKSVNFYKFFSQNVYQNPTNFVFLFWLYRRLVIFQSWLFLTLGNIAFWLLLLLATVLPFLFPHWHWFKNFTSYSCQPKNNGGHICNMWHIMAPTRTIHLHCMFHN